MSIFEIQGQAKRNVNYDIAVVSITFTEKGENSYLASKAVMRECEQFFEKLDVDGITSSNAVLGDDSVSEDRYADSSKVIANRKVEFRIAFNMEVINRIRQIIDENEYSTRFHIEYELSNEDQMTRHQARNKKEELLKEALLDSKKKAEDLAEALNMTVIGVKSVEAYSKLNGRTEGIACERSICDYMGVPQFSHSNKLQAKEKELSESIEVKWNLV